MADKNEMLGPKETAALMGLKLSSFYYYKSAKPHRIPAPDMVMGNRSIWFRSNVIAWLEKYNGGE